MPERIVREHQIRVSLRKIYYSLLILQELGILEFRLKDSILSELDLHPELRVNLDDSVILQKLKERAVRADEH